MKNSGSNRIAEVVSQGRSMAWGESFQCRMVRSECHSVQLGGSAIIKAPSKCPIVRGGGKFWSLRRADRRTGKKWCRERSKRGYISLFCKMKLLFRWFTKRGLLKPPVSRNSKTCETTSPVSQNNEKHSTKHLVKHSTKPFHQKPYLWPLASSVDYPWNRFFGGKGDNTSLFHLPPPPQYGCLLYCVCKNIYAFRFHR